jgi:hypothetical protein
MAELHFVKSSGSLKPADPDTEAALNGLNVGEVVSANLHRPSAARQYARRWYALVTLGYEQQDRIADFEKFVDACLVAGGYFEFAPRLDGSTVKVPVRPSFSKMSELEFSRLCRTTQAVLSAIVGCDKRALHTQD